MDHPNVLKFFNWYETNNHYWIIVEYCSGGDLMNLLMQDQSLPEETVHLFSLDLVRGLQ
jgi:serine/threonine-protein kinase ULK4